MSTRNAGISTALARQSTFGSNAIIPFTHRSIPIEVFDGSQNIQAWIAKLEYHFKENNIPELQKVPRTRIRLSSDVRRCVDAIATHIKAEWGEQWVWNWPSLRVALLGMELQIEYYRGLKNLEQKAEKEEEEARTKVFKRLLDVVGFGIGACIFLPVTYCGAAWLLGEVGGMAAAAIIDVGAVAEGVEVGTRCAEANKELANAREKLRKLKKRGDHPSISWADGDKFIPLQELLVVVSELAAM